MALYLSNGTSNKPLSRTELIHILNRSLKTHQVVNPSLDLLLPKWTSVSQGIVLSLCLTILSLLLIRAAFDWIFTADTLLSGVLPFGLICGIAYVLMGWGWGGLWHLGDCPHYDALPIIPKCLKIFSLSAVIVSTLLIFFFHWSAFKQLPIWYRLIESKTSFKIDYPQKTLTISGTIGPTTALDLSKILEHYPETQTIRLHLNGGLIEEARKMHQLIVRSRLNTSVEEECASACTIVFMGGWQRTLYEGGRLGFHRYHYIAHESPEPIDRLEKSYLISIGFEPNFVDRALSSDVVWYPSLQELAQANVITSVGKL